MSWSLQLHSGDFALSGTSLAAVTDTTKLSQDLRCALAERMGTDDMHPEYGSLLDGGVMPSGQVVPSVIGMSDINQATTAIQSEIQRVASAYQTQQLNRAKADRTTYNRVSLTPGEVLLKLADIQMTQAQDTIDVLVTLQTAQGESLALALPLLTNS